MCSIKHFYSVQYRYIYVCVFKYIYVCTYIYTRKETSTNKSLSPWEPRTLTKEKEGVHVLKSRKYGNNFPFSPGSQQQRERDGHCKLLKQEDLCRSGKQGGGNGMGAVGQCGKVKHAA